MIDFTPDARRRFDEYLMRIRATLRSGATADDVEQSVREHIEVALNGAPAPIGMDRLSPVLEQLGSPERWVSEDELPAWRRMMLRIQHGPDDWRLAYASFAITFLMVVTFPIGGILLAVPAFLLSRAVVELLANRGEPLGARRWLINPPIVIVMACVTGVLLIAPIVAAAAIALGDGALDQLTRWDFDDLSRLDQLRVGVGFVSMAAGVWWIAMSGIYALFYRPYRWLFLPVTERLRRGHAFVLMLVGAIFGGLGAALLFAV